jgi:hypothetical protein
MKSKTPTHRVLSALMSGTTTMAALHKATKTDGQSQNRWGVDVLSPMLQRKLIRQDGHTLVVTSLGAELFYDLERKSNVDLKKVAMPREKQVMKTETYMPSKNAVYVRPGANDFLKCPSRVGKELVYRKDVDQY